MGEGKIYQNLNAHSLSLFDSDPYHSTIQEDKPSSKYLLKAPMTDWLLKTNTPCQRDMCETELMEQMET